MNYMERLRKFSVTFFLALGLILCVNVMDVTALAAGETAVTTSAGASTASEEADDAESSTATGDGSGQTSGSGSSVGTQPPASHAASSGDTNNNGTGGSTGGANTIGDGGDSSDDANTNGDGSGSSDDANTDGDGSGSSDNANASGDGSGSSDNANASGDGSDLSDDTNTNEGDTLPPQTSQAVQQLLDIVSELPDAVSWDDADTLLAQIAACQTIYDSLTADEQAQADVAAALAQLQALKAKVDSVTTTTTEGKYIFTLHRDGTAAVTSYNKEATWDGIIDIPSNVAFGDADYRVTAIGERAFFGLNKDAVLTLPDGLEEIGELAFYQVYLCGNSLVIPDSVTSIGKQAFRSFRNNTSEKQIEQITFGSGLKTVGEYAFWTDTKEALTSAVELYFNAPVSNFPASAFKWQFHPVSKIEVAGYKYSMDSSFSNAVKYIGSANLIYLKGLDLSHAYTADNLKEIIAEIANSETKTQTIAITKSVFSVRDTIVIPNGVTITLTDDGVAPRTIENVYGMTVPIFRVENGGTLIIDATSDAGLTITSQNTIETGIKASVCQVDGKLVLKNGEIIGSVGSRRNVFSGTIVIGNGGQFDMTGGVITQTEISGLHSAPIIVGSGAAFNMSGGAITGNYNYNRYVPLGENPYSAGAVLVYGWNPSDVGGKMTLSGNAVISNNVNGGMGGGAITLVGNAQLIMDGGTISGNTSASKGGGICVVGPTQPMQVDQYDAQCVFVMNGGEISGNKAQYGGGIFSNSNHVTLNAGKILNNKATATGGGVYVETPSYGSTAAYLKNAVITGNHATYMGGGMYFCPTGTGSLYVNEGSAIFDNSADSAADDFVSIVGGILGGDGTKKAILAQRVLGGGLVNWFRDGGVLPASSSNDWGTVNKDVPRYPVDPNHLVSAGEYNYGIALKAILSDGAKELAMANGTLFIMGNTAGRGGGVGSNGNATAGDSTVNEWTVQVNKTWDSSIPEASRNPVKVQLVVKHGDKEYALETVELNAGNDWKAEFPGLPASIQGNVSVKELLSEDSSYYADYTLTEAGNVVSITVNNIAYGILNIHKDVVGGGNTAANQEYTFQVTGKDYGKTVTVKGSGTVTLSDLKAGTYRVVEIQDGIAVKGYDLIVIGENDVTIASGETSDITITNEYVRLPSGSLTVVKNVIGGGTAAAEKVYTFSITGPDGYQNTVTITGNGRVTLEDLTPGDYTVTENDAQLDGYTWTVSGNGLTVTVRDVLGGVATITNTYSSGGGGSTPDPDPEEPPVDVPDPDVPLVPGPDPEEPPVDIPEVDPPLVDIPEVDPPLVDIPEENPPLVNVPVENPPLVELSAPEVPLADVPNTGDDSALWLSVALAAAASIVCVKLLEKKKAK